MHRVQANDLPWKSQRSPQGKYELARRSLTQAVGGEKDVGTWGGGHPFEVEIHRLPPGKWNFPLHQHAAQWEAYYILSGQGEVRGEAGSEPVKSGDYLVFKPGEAHQFHNNSTEDLVFMVIADQPQADILFYPDSGKWMHKPQRQCFEMQQVDYFAGEE
jgi:uncharacterized cupin superfamily protein